jgi:NAD(P)-dependent dehydrogenase (short-subunit alcohol dehydrogenase family)
VSLGVSFVLILVEIGGCSTPIVVQPCVDVRDTILLNAVVEDIANREGRVDGLIAAAAIQQVLARCWFSMNSGVFRSKFCPYFSGDWRL